MRKSRFRPSLLLIALTFASSAYGHDIDRPFLNLGVEVDAPKGFVDMCRGDVTFCGGAERSVAGDATTDSSVVTSALVDAPPARSDPSGEASARSKQTTSVFKNTDFEGKPPTAGWLAARTRGKMAGAALDLAPVLLDRINRYVNARVLQRTDQQVYGRPEVWHRSGVGHGAAGDCEDLAIEKRFELIAAGFPVDRLAFAVVYERQVGLHAVLIARTSTGDYVLDSRTPYINRWDRTSYSFVTVQSRREPMRWYALGASPA